MTKKLAIRAPGVQLVTTKDGAMVQVNIGDLPRPDRSMSCNVVDASLRGSTVELVFGQAAPGATELAAALVVQIPSKSLPGVIDIGDSGKFRQALFEYIKRGGWDVVSPPISGYPTRIAMERASTMSMSFADEEADIRFYRLIPSEFRKMQSRQKYTPEFMQPVVEIALSTELLGSLVRRIDAIRVEQKGG